MLIQSFINPICSSNTYIIETHLDSVIIIDPGNSDILPLTNWLNVNNKTPNFIILTHEHFDHIAGINNLSKHFNFQLLTSEACRRNIGGSKKNLSKYYETIDEFTVTLPVTSVKDNEILNLNGSNFKFLHTPGHSEGSMCIIMENIVFTGDTLMNASTPLNLPGSNKNHYFYSLQKLNQNMNNQTIIYPGHGLPFPFICKFSSHNIL